MSTNNVDLFRFWVEQGWKYRRARNSRMREREFVQEYKSRIKREVELIIEKDFVDYFCMVSDLVRYAKDSGIAVGPGRGSAAGSLVCYLLRITEIDPMQYPMLFERFMDPTRTDEPDIDIDFQDDRREEVFAYATRKYGEDRVANIGTFTRYLGKNSIDDVARVYHIPQWIANAIKSKLIERAEGHPRFSKSVEDTINSFSDIRQLVSERPELGFALKLEGNVRNFGIHAAGMVVASVPLDEVTATYQKIEGGSRSGDDGKIRRSIAFDKYDASYLGLLKIDVLGLSTLGMLAKVCEIAGISFGSLYDIPLDDPATWELFKTGDLLGVFQFEGITTRRILKQVEPQTIMELSHVNALARPGASDATYISNKQNGRMPGFPHPIMRQHLSWTQGVIVYEEQILMILRDLGGFPPAELNRMRKIIHDKLGSTVFNEYFARFVKGCAAHGLPESTAQQIWDTMVGASGYAFNIAHSVCYSVIGYWVQYLKSRYVAASYAGQLIKCTDGDDWEVRRSKIVAEALRKGISVGPPDLLESGPDWTVCKRDPNRIVAGFTSIPGIGPKTTERIIAWRDENLRQSGLLGSQGGMIELDDDEDFEYDWSDLKEVKGIGPKTIETIKAFVSNEDPFSANKTAKTLESIRNSIRSGEVPGVPIPTHVSSEISDNGDWVIFLGIVRKRKYYDAAEQLQKRTVGELEYEDAIKQLDDPRLLKYVALYCEDEYGEQIVVRISRWKYPEYARQIESIKLNRDLVVAQGKTSGFGGISIQTKRLVVLEP